MDLRQRIVEHVRAGHSRRSAAEKFAVAPSSAVRIVALHGSTGSLEPKLKRAGRRSVLDAHRAYLMARIEQTPDITLPELAAELAGRGVRIDPSNLSRWFIRNNYSFKKNTAGQRTRAARHQEKA
jgi:transposase